jgi:hypothetical protein
MPNSEKTPTKWQYSDAKKLLERDILDGKTDGKTPKQVHEMHAEYKQYKSENFNPNFKRLKEKLTGLQNRAATQRGSTMPNSEKKPTKWQYSDAKKLLERDILDGKTDGKTPEQVHEMHAEYKQYKSKNFNPNFKRLKEKLKGLQDRADEDEAAFLHDEALNLRANNKPYPRWGGTVAEQLLKIDIDVGKQTTLKPRELQATRPEYSPYPPKVFRDHIQQELRARCERSYWLARHREKQAKKKH